MSTVDHVRMWLTSTLIRQSTKHQSSLHYHRLFSNVIMSLLFTIIIISVVASVSSEPIDDTNTLPVRTILKRDVQAHHTAILHHNHRKRSQQDAHPEVVIVDASDTESKNSKSSPTYSFYAKSEHRDGEEHKPPERYQVAKFDFDHGKGFWGG